MCLFFPYSYVITLPLCCVGILLRLRIVRLFNCFGFADLLVLRVFSSIASQRPSLVMPNEDRAHAFPTQPPSKQTSTRMYPLKHEGSREAPILCTPRNISQEVANCRRDSQTLLYSGADPSEVMTTQIAPFALSSNVEDRLGIPTECYPSSLGITTG